MRLALTNRSKLYSCSSQNDECRYGCQHLFHRLVTKPGPRLNMPRSVFRHFLTLVNNTKKWKQVHSLDTILYGLRLISHSSVGFRQMYKCILFCVKKKSPFSKSKLLIDYNRRYTKIPTFIFA